MGKGSRKRHTGAVSAAGSYAALGPAPTAAPGPSDESWDGEEVATNAAPDIDALATSPTELFDKFVQGKVPLTSKTVFLLLILVWAMFSGWLFSQDNAAGRLDSVAGIGWFFVKVLAMTILVGAGAFGVYRLKTVKEDS